LGGSARAIVGVHVSHDKTSANETSADKSKLEASRALVLIMIPSRLFSALCGVLKGYTG
jgi:hypothetical protein